MSVRMQVKVWERSKHSGNDLLMLIAIADFADENGVAYPAVATLAKKCRMTSRSVNRVMAELRKSGELQVRQNEGPRGTNVYQINLPLTEMPRTPDRNVTPDGIVTLTEVSRTPDISVPKPLTEMSDEPSVNHQEPPVEGDKPPVSSKAADHCPCQQIVNLYHETMPKNPRCKIIGPGRKAAIRARWIEAAKLTCKPFGYDNREDGLKAWRTFFEICADSDFLTGRAPATNGRPPFLADIDFLMRPQRFANILENKYHRTAELGTSRPAPALATQDAMFRGAI